MKKKEAIQPVKKKNLEEKMEKIGNIILKYGRKNHLLTPLEAKRKVFLPIFWE